MNKKIKAVCFTGRRQIGEQVINMMQTLEKEVIRLIEKGAYEFYVGMAEVFYSGNNP